MFSQQVVVRQEQARRETRTNERVCPTADQLEHCIDGADNTAEIAIAEDSCTTSNHRRDLVPTWSVAGFDGNLNVSVRKKYG